MATQRNRSERSLTNCAAMESTRTLMLKVMATRAAAITNHFIWRRSSPRDRLNLRTREPKEASKPTGIATVATTNGIDAIVVSPVFRWFGPNGFDQFAEAKVIAP